MSDDATRLALDFQGFDAGEQDVFEHETFDEPCIPNPYRGDSDG